MKTNRKCKAFTGLSLKELKYFLKHYESEVKNYYEQLGIGKNKNRPGRPRTLDSTHEALLGLNYMKEYPKFDQLGIKFDVSASTAHRISMKCIDIFMRILSKKGFLPKDDSEITLTEMKKMYRKKDKLYIDGVERPIRRPKTNQKQHYSGKKKMHTAKNLILSDESRKIVVVTKTEKGKNHDFNMYKKSNLSSIVPNKCKTYVDLGFQGINEYQDNVEIPIKKKKNKDLTKSQKLYNKKVSSKRVKVEHSIGGVKRMEIAKGIFRSINDKVKNCAVKLSAGFWNLHLKFTNSM